MAITARPPKPTARTVVEFAVVVVVGAVIPLFVASRYGALRVPRSDDWSYLRTLFEWDRTGIWDFNYWVSMTLVGQVVATKPVVWLFPDSIVAVRIAVGVAGVAGLWALRGLARTVRVAPSPTLLVVVGTALMPLWGPLASTYMTDVPSFSVQMIALWLTARAVQRPTLTTASIATAYAWAFFAISIRQYGAVVALAIVITFAWSRWSSSRRFGRDLVVATTLLGLASVALLLWWNGVPHGKRLSPRLPNSGTVQLAITSAGGFLRLAGFALLPLVVYLRPWKVVQRAVATNRRITNGITIATVGLFLVGLLIDDRAPFVGNYFDRNGVLADDILHGQRPKIMPTAAFEALQVLASASALVLVLLLVPTLHRWFGANRAQRSTIARSASPHTVLLVACTFGFFVAYELAILTTLPIFDRYALGALPLVGLLAARGAQSAAANDADAYRDSAATLPFATTMGIGFTVALVAFTGLVYSTESASFDAARWHVAEAAVAKGYAVEDVYGSYEWAGFNLGRAPRTASTVKEQQRLRRAYYQGFCIDVIVTSQRRSDFVVESRSDAWLRDPAWIYAVKTDRPCAVGLHG